MAGDQNERCVQQIQRKSYEAAETFCQSSEYYTKCEKAMQRKYTQSSEKEGRAERRSARANEKKAQSDEAWRNKYAVLAREKTAHENSYNELQVTHMDMEMQHEE